jgi:hypothetical protein
VRFDSVIYTLSNTFKTQGVTFMKIIGDCSEIEKSVRGLLKDLLPEGSSLEFSEIEDWRSAGTLMDDHNEYFGVLTITLRQSGGVSKQLAKINSRSINLSGSGQYLCDRNNYDYVITEERVLNWFPRQ